MASQINNLGTTFLLIAILSIFMIGLYSVSQDIANNNTKLDTKSQEVIISLGAEYNNNFEGFNMSIEQTGVTNDSSFESVDAFSRQYLEDKSEIKQKETTLNKILLFPSLVLIVIGVEDMTLLIIWSGLIYTLITLYLGLQIYKAARTGEVD